MNKTKLLLSESWNDFTADQQIYLSKWENELWPLIEECINEHPHLLSEGTLTNDQILSIFKQSEELATQSGDNVTKLGKAGKAAAAAGKGAIAAAKIPVGIAKKIDQKINELGALAQKAGPVKNADAKFEELKKKIAAENSDSKVIQGIQKVSDWAKANPGKSSLAVGILTAIAAFVGGPMGGAAAGLILRASKDLLQGEKLSTAVGKSIKTGVYGALAGMAFKALTDNIIDNIASASDADLTAMEAAMKQANDAAAEANLSQQLGIDLGILKDSQSLGLTGQINNFYYDYDVVLNPEQLAQYKALSSAVDAAKSFSPEKYAAIGKFHDFMAQMQQNTDAKNLTAAVKALYDLPKNILTGENVAKLQSVADNSEALLDTIKSFGSAAGSIVQGALQTVNTKAKDAIKAKPVEPEVKDQLEADLKNKPEVKESFEKFYNANEDILNEDIKGALKSFGKKAGQAIGQAKQDLVSKVTANKLMKAWKKAGSPTDSAEVYKILSQGGVDDEAIKNVAAASNVELEPSPEQQKPAAGEQPTSPVGEAGPEIIALKDLIVKNDVVEEVKLLLQRQLNPGGEGGSTAAGGDSAEAPATPGADGQPASDKPAASDKPRENLSVYFNNWIKNLNAAQSKGDKIKLTKELVNTVADRGDDNNSQAAISLLQKYGKDIDPNVKNAAMQRLKDRVYMEKSFFNWFKSILAEHYITLSEIGYKATLNESFKNYIILTPINKTSFGDIVKRYR